MTWARHGPSPGSRPLRTSGSRPARTTEDLPLPEGPTTASESAIEHPRGQLGDETLAADEEVGVRRLVGRQRSIRLATGPLGADEGRAPAASLDETQYLVEHRRTGDRRRRASADCDRCGSVQPVGGCPLGPGRSLPPGEPRQAVRHRDRGLDRFRIDTLGGHDRADLVLRHRRQFERAEARALELADELHSRPVATASDDHEHQRHPLGRRRERADRLDARRWRPLDVVDHEQERRHPAARPDGVDDRTRPGPCREQMQSGRAGHVLDCAAVGDRRRRQLGDETRSSRADRPQHGAHLAGAAERTRPRRSEPAELVFAADKRRVGAQGCRKYGVAARSRQRRILLHDPLLEVSQFVTRLEPEFVPEHRARRAGTRRGHRAGGPRHRDRASATTTPVRGPARRRPPAPCRARPSPPLRHSAGPRRGLPARRGVAPRGGCGHRRRSRPRANSIRAGPRQSASAASSNLTDAAKWPRRSSAAPSEASRSNRATSVLAGSTLSL